MQTLDRRTITEARVPSLVLMERAGAGAANSFNTATGRCAARPSRFSAARVTTVAMVSSSPASCASFKPGLRCFSSYPPPI